MQFISLWTLDLSFIIKTGQPVVAQKRFFFLFFTDTIIDYFSHTASFSSFPLHEHEVAIFVCLPKNTKMQYAK